LEFFWQRFRRRDGPNFKTHSYISREYADMGDAAVRQTFRHFVHCMPGLLLSGLRTQGPEARRVSRTAVGGDFARIP